MTTITKMFMVGTVASNTAEIALDGLLADGWTIESFEAVAGTDRHEVRCSRPFLMDETERKRLGKRTCRNAFDWERMRP